MKLAESVNEIYSSRGKKVVHLDLTKGNPPPEDIMKAILGPTGNLRAPTLRIGKTLLAGFNRGSYLSVFDVQ